MTSYPYGDAHGTRRKENPQQEGVDEHDAYVCKPSTFFGRGQGSPGDKKLKEANDQKNTTEKRQSNHPFIFEHEFCHLIYSFKAMFPKAWRVS